MFLHSAGLGKQVRALTSHIVSHLGLRIGLMLSQANFLRVPVAGKIVHGHRDLGLVRVEKLRLELCKRSSWKNERRESAPQVSVYAECRNFFQ